MAEPRILMVAVDSPGCCFLAVSTHGPLSTSNDETIPEFWARVTGLITTHADGRQVIHMTDMNATIVATIPGHTGSWSDKKGNAASEAAMTFLQDTSSWVPATYHEHIAKADAKHIAGTCYDRTGTSMTRIDFIVLSGGIGCCDGAVENWYDFVMPHAGYDHVPTTARIHVPFTGSVRLARRRVPDYNRQAVKDPVKM